MSGWRSWWLIPSVALLSGSICVPSALGGKADLEDIHLPDGFSISLFAEDVPNARGMCWGARGTLFVGSRDAGTVHALRDSDGDGVVDARWELAKGLNMPVGVAFKDGDLYVSEVSRILRYRAIEDHLDAPPEPLVVTEAYPTEKHHGWKYIAFGPDGDLYVPVGAPCNICKSADSLFATITRLNVETGAIRIVAHGVRNSVGFDWDPMNNDLWFTDNGRDRLGDDVPDCELNHLTGVGQHFGYPFCHAGDVLDPEFGKDQQCDTYTPPAAKLGAHVAPLGMHFYEGTSFPPKYKNAIFIAEHGSWNRTTPVGYQVVVALKEPDGTLRVEPFATGWLDGARAKGRPVDVLEAPNGDLLISDDAADRIYRISYKN